MLQVSLKKIVVPKPPQERELRRQMHDIGYVTFKNFLGRDLKVALSELVRQTRFQKKIHLHKIPGSKRKPVGRDQIGGGGASNILNLLLTDPVLLATFEKILDMRLSQNFSSRYYKISKENQGYIDWHSDNVRDRAAQLFVYLSPRSIPSGHLAIKSLEHGGSEHLIDNLEFGDATLVAISDSRMHCIKPVRHSPARIEFTLYFHKLDR